MVLPRDEILDTGVYVMEGPQQNPIVGLGDAKQHIIKETASKEEDPIASKRENYIQILFTRIRGRGRKRKHRMMPSHTHH